MRPVDAGVDNGLLAGLVAGAAERDQVVAVAVGILLCERDGVQSRRPRKAAVAGGGCDDRRDGGKRANHCTCPAWTHKASVPRGVRAPMHTTGYPSCRSM